MPARSIRSGHGRGSVELPLAAVAAAAHPRFGNAQLYCYAEAFATPPNMAVVVRGVAWSRQPRLNE